MVTGVRVYVTVPWAVIYGIWDYIKNSGKFDADNMTLEWVGSLPGKREYRRFVGDYVLNQNDIMTQAPFEDRVAFGGCSIDLHPPQGVYAQESGSKHLHADGIYHIPFRCLYSINVSNLLFAGRDISASHVAFGTTRVMATCAVVGEAAGAGAALCVEKSVTPRQLYQRHMPELQQVMLRQDASIIGLPNQDPADQARHARVSASSALRQIKVATPAETQPLASDIGLLFPVEPRLDRIDLLLDASEATTLEVQAWDTGRPENYVPRTLQARAKVQVPPGAQQWVAVDLPWQPDCPQNAFIVVKANEHVMLHLSHQPMTGVLSFVRTTKPVVDPALEDHQQPDQPVVEWTMKPLVRKPFCFRLVPETEAYSAGKVIDGYARPYGGPHMWISEPSSNAQEEWLELQWQTPLAAGELHLTFNDDVNEDLINLHHHRTPFDIIPELVRDYRVEACLGGRWVTVGRVEENHKRKRVHRWEPPIMTDGLRLVVESTNGGPRAEVAEMRVYAEPAG